MPECSKLELENYFHSFFISFFLSLLHGVCVCVCGGGGGGGGRLIYHHSMLRSLRTPINAIVIYNSRLFLFVYRPPAVRSDNPRNIANG